MNDSTERFSTNPSRILVVLGLKASVEFSAVGGSKLGLNLDKNLTLCIKIKTTTAWPENKKVIMKSFRTSLPIDLHPFHRRVEIPRLYFGIIRVTPSMKNNFRFTPRAGNGMPRHTPVSISVSPEINISISSFPQLVRDNSIEDTSDGIGAKTTRVITRINSIVTNLATGIYSDAHPTGSGTVILIAIHCNGSQTKHVIGQMTMNMGIRRHRWCAIVGGSAMEKRVASIPWGVCRGTSDQRLQR